MNKFKKVMEIFGAILGVILAFLAMAAVLLFICALVAYPVMWSWNYTLPVITNGALLKINVYQAFVLFLLCRLLVGNYSNGQQKK